MPPKARLKREELPADYFQLDLPVHVTILFSPPKLQEDLDRFRGALTYTLVSAPAMDRLVVVEHLHVVQSSTPRYRNLDPPLLGGRQDRAHGMLIDRECQCDAISSERIRSTGCNGFPDTIAAEFFGPYSHSAMPVASWMGAMVVRRAYDAEYLSQPQPMLHCAFSISGPHSVQVRIRGIISFGQAVHGDDFYHRRELRRKVLPTDATVAAQVADVMGNEKALHSLARQASQMSSHLFQVSGTDDLPLCSLEVHIVIPVLN